MEGLGVLIRVSGRRLVLGILLVAASAGGILFILATFVLAEVVSH